jgi:hypothetical protein
MNANYPTQNSSTGQGIYKESENKYVPEKTYEKYFSNSIIREKIRQFHSGKYSEKYIRTYLDFILMGGIIDNLIYLEFLKCIEEKV